MFSRSTVKNERDVLVWIYMYKNIYSKGGLGRITLLGKCLSSGHAISITQWITQAPTQTPDHKVKLQDKAYKTFPQTVGKLQGGPSSSFVTHTFSFNFFFYEVENRGYQTICQRKKRTSTRLFGRLCVGRMEKGISICGIATAYCYGIPTVYQGRLCFLEGGSRVGVFSHQGLIAFVVRYVSAVRGSGNL